MRIYLTIFLAVLSTVVVPVPEEAVLLGAGYVVRLGRAAFLGSLGAAWLAVMLGDTVSYFVGRELIGRALRTRLGRRMLPEERRVWAEHLVAANGARAVVLARFFVGLRGFIYFAVGASRYPFARFLVIDGIAGVVEITGLVGIGFALGELRGRVGVGIDLVAAAVLFAALFAPLFVRAATRRKREAAGDDGKV